MSFLLLTLWACTPDPDPPALPDTAGSALVPPGILFVVSDTTRYDHLGLHGDSRGLTPHLDAFFADATDFQRAYAHASWTKPSMATVFTSQLPDEHGVTDWDLRLTEDQLTFPQVLHAEGWATAAAVAHSAFDPDSNGFHHGFDTFDRSAFESRGYPGDFTTSQELANAAEPMLLDLLQGDQPWLLWVHFFDPHNEYFDHDDVVNLGTSIEARYAEELAYTDKHIGRLLEHVEGLDQVTVVFMADHGEELREHGRIGHAHTVYDELVHVPLLVRSPHLPPGVVDDPIGLVDLAPTLLDIAGVAAPASFRGHSLLEPYQPAPIFLETRRFGDRRGVIDGDLKLSVDQQTDPAPDNPVELFDLMADPGETHDLEDEMPEEAQRLVRLLESRYPELDPGSGATQPGQ